ncbi:class I SAM-dependent methyltransferase [Candidatus Woesearchaeota archaeon]|nr:class I SAM-dependent methyltransferase [Candidatus Woesearchaeota archaeon]
MAETKALATINKNGGYLRLLQGIRNYFLASNSKEQLNYRLRIFYKLLSPLFLRNGPRRKQDFDVIERLEFFYQNTETGDRVVDVGCFDGYFSQKLTQKGCRVVGVDSLDLVVQKTIFDDQETRYVAAFGEEIPFGDSKFDVGIYSHVLEHVFDPELVLIEARRIIKPGGKIIVVVPFGMGVDANHLREYDRDGLVGMVSKFFPEVTYFSSIGDGHGCIGIKPK